MGRTARASVERVRGHRFSTMLAFRHLRAKEWKRREMTGATQRPQRRPARIVPSPPRSRGWLFDPPDPALASCAGPQRERCGSGGDRRFRKRACGSPAAPGPDGPGLRLWHGHPCSYLPGKGSLENRSKVSGEQKPGNKSGQDSKAMVGPAGQEPRRPGLHLRPGPSGPGAAGDPRARKRKRRSPPDPQRSRCGPAKLARAWSGGSKGQPRLRGGDATMRAGLLCGLCVAPVFSLCFNPFTLRRRDDITLPNTAQILRFDGSARKGSLPLRGQMARLEQVRRQWRIK